MDGNIDGITLPVDGQKREVRRLERVGKPLERREVVDGLTVELEDDVAGLLEEQLWALAFRVHGLTGHDHIIWLVSGVTPMLIYARIGRPPLAWLYSVDPLPFPVRAGSQYLAVLSRLLGRPLPPPAFHDLTDPGGLATRLAALLAAGTKVTVTTYASSGVRISTAARERGIDLRGVC